MDGHGVIRVNCRRRNGVVGVVTQRPAGVRFVQIRLRRAPALFCVLLIAVLFCAYRASAYPQGTQAEQAFLEYGVSWASPDTSSTWTVLRQAQAASQDQTGSITGTVVDQSGAFVVRAHVKLSRENGISQEATSDENGRFSFASIAPGPFQITATAEGFAVSTFSGTLHAGESYLVPPVALAVAGASAEVQVSMTPTEIAEAEIKDEEKQRVLGIVPNFYVTYNPAAVPLNRKQKFELAWKSTIDPVNFGLTAGSAAIEQATDAFGGYGQGAEGFAKRYGASYADLVTGTFIGSAILPSLLKQDPRYFYKGTGSKRSRVLYAIANAVICKGDNGHWQANYSAILGGIASGGISNLYYPDSDRGAGLVFENAAIGLATTAAANILQEFVIRRLTPHAPSYTPAQPTAQPTP